MTEAAFPHVIVIDDEEDLREPTAAYVADQGFDVEEANGGRALDALLAKRVPDLVVLDVTMPEEDGFSIARRLRSAYPSVGIVMLTARRDVIDRVVGLEIGADDYLMKPFEPRELVARIRSVLRRLHTAQAQSVASAEAHDADEDTVTLGDRAYHREFWVPTHRGQIRVPVDTIDWIEAAKDYALLHTRDRSHMVRITMAALEEALDPADMIRVHRSAFVRPSAVLQISTMGRHMVLVLGSGTSVRVGPRHWGEVRSRLQR